MLWTVGGVANRQRDLQEVALEQDLHDRKGFGGMARSGARHLRLRFAGSLLRSRGWLWRLEHDCLLEEVEQLQQVTSVTAHACRGLDSRVRIRAVHHEVCKGQGHLELDGNDIEICVLGQAACPRPASFSSSVKRG